MNLVKNGFILVLLTLSVSCSISRPKIYTGPVGGGNQGFTSTDPRNNSNVDTTRGNPLNLPNIQTRKNHIYPFDLIVDTVAYMNCVGHLSPQDNNFFSFKFASLNEGIKLSDEFLDQVDPYTKQQINTDVRQSPYLKTKAQISLSPIGNPAVNVGSGKNQQQNLGFFYPLFSSPTFVNEITKRYESKTIAPNRPLQTTFPLAGSNLYTITSSFGTNLIFTLTYSKSDHRAIPIRNDVYYGKTYDPFFDGGENGKSYLVDIEETSLSTNRKQGRWDCPENLRFPIYRHSNIPQTVYDRNKRFFDENDLSPESECLPANRAVSRTERNLLEAILPRGTFLVGEAHVWDGDDLVNTEEPCLVPRDLRHSCYAKNDVIRIEFDKNENCSLLDRYRRCPSYLSICQRQ